MVSPRTFWLGLNATRQMVHTIERPPINRVENVGVRKRGWTRPNADGIAFHRAIDRVVRAVARIVVWVDADADVSTVMITSLSSGEPNTPWPRALSTSLELADRNLVPWYDAAAALTRTEIRG